MITPQEIFVAWIEEPDKNGLNLNRVYLIGMVPKGTQITDLENVDYENYYSQSWKGIRGSVRIGKLEEYIDVLITKQMRNHLIFNHEGKMFG